MDKIQALQWLVGLLVPILTLCIAGLWRAQNRHGDRLFELSERLSKIETGLTGEVSTLKAEWGLFLKLMGERIGRLIHSPNDHWGLDIYIDKFHREELSREEISQFIERIIQVEQRDNLEESAKLKLLFMRTLLEVRYMSNVPVSHPLSST